MDRQILKKTKLILRDVILSSTSHGLPNIIRSENLSLKILWSISTLISAALCAFLIIQSIINYYKYDVTTKIRVINEVSSEIPTITVCNLNLFTTKYAADNLITPSNIDPDSPTFKFSFTYSDSIDQKKLSDSKEKLIRSAYLDIKPINKSSIVYFYHQEYGNCYKINSGYDENGNQVPILQMIRPGQIQSLFVLLNISITKELKRYYLNYGGIVFIHNRTESPLSVDGIYLKPATVTNVQLARTFSNQMPKPYSNCDGNTEDINSYDSHLFKLVFTKTGSYSQKSCMDLCYQIELITKCNCSDHAVESFDDSPKCTPESDLNCSYEVYKDVFDNLEEKCFNKCPIKCNKNTLTKTVSVNDLGTDDWNEFFTNYYGLDEAIDVRNDLAAVNVFYDSLGYTEITETETIDAVSLLSNIGGIAGLFLGVSFLSFVESVEFFVRVIHLFFHKANKSVQQ